MFEASFMGAGGTARALQFMIATGAKASSSTASSSLETALVATGAGVLFTTVGFLLVMGARRRIMDPENTTLDDVPAIDPLQWFNIKFFFGGNKERWAGFNSEVVPLVVGGAFMLLGGAALITGLVRLLMLLP